MTVRVLAADGVTPVSGATIGWSATNDCSFRLAAAHRPARSPATRMEMRSPGLTPAATGVATITATLAPAAYSSAKSVSATLNATESASDIGVFAPYLWIAQGASVSLPLTARVLSNGTARRTMSQ